ncbi:MAG: TIGR00730 family Rossman fold protein [Sporolactobacillus sp.]
MNSLAVFCGSSAGDDPSYSHAAAALGHELAARKITLVYGGASVGLMGACADAVLSDGGTVIGVIPEILQKREITHPRLSKLYIVPGMHERKAKMMELADAFLALPGGTGTMEEIFEAITWSQIGLHRKPCAFYNVSGYYTPLARFLDHMVERRFLSVDYRSKLIMSDSLDTIMQDFATYEPPKVKTYARR